MRKVRLLVAPYKSVRNVGIMQNERGELEAVASCCLSVLHASIDDDGSQWWVCSRCKRKLFTVKSDTPSCSAHTPSNPMEVRQWVANWTLMDEDDFDVEFSYTEWA